MSENVRKRQIRSISVEHVCPKVSESLDDSDIRTCFGHFDGRHNDGGKRVMVKVGVLRASNKCWEIQTVPWPSYSDEGKAWWTIRVVPDERPRIGWLAWNGKRLAKSSQLKQFQEEYPELIDRLPDELERIFG